MRLCGGALGAWEVPAGGGRGWRGPGSPERRSCKDVTASLRHAVTTGPGRTAYHLLCACGWFFTARGAFPAHASGTVGMAV